VALLGFVRADSQHVLRTVQAVAHHLGDPLQCILLHTLQRCSSAFSLFFTLRLLTCCFLPQLLNSWYARLLSLSSHLPPSLIFDGNTRHYLWATAAIYFFSVFMRFLLIFIRNGRGMPRGTVEALACGAVRVTIECPPGHRWKAGQHYFLNFIRARPFESHPYTIANAPRVDFDAAVSRCLPQHFVQILMAL
jgi:hypothetical protein